MGIERAIGKAIIERLAGTGLSANAIVKMATGQGGGYRRTDMLADIRVAEVRFKNQYWVEKLKANDVIPQGLMAETTLKADANYRVYGTLSYYSEEDDEYYEETKSFYRDDLTNKGNWEDDFVDEYSDRYQAKGENILGFSIIAVEHNRGYGY